MGKDIEKLLEHVRKYLRRLHDECKLPPDLENGRMQLLCKIDDFYRDHLDKLGKEDGYILNKNLKVPEQNADNQSLSSQTTQTTLVSRESTETSNMVIGGIQPIAVASLSPAVKAGFLSKKRKQEKIQKVFGPQKRWCVIKDGIFFYYDSDKALKQKGAFYLAGYEASACRDVETSYTFNLTCPGKRSFTFTTDTNDSLNQWTSTINLQSQLKTKGDQSDYDIAAKINCNDSGNSLEPPVAPPRKASAGNVTNVEQHDVTCDSIESYEDADVINNAGVQGSNKHQSTISTGTVYEDTDHMELQDEIVIPGSQQRIESTSSDVYEDTDNLNLNPVGYSNNFGSQRRILSDSSEGMLYEDTDEVSCVTGKMTGEKDDESADKIGDLPKTVKSNNNNASYINANKGSVVNNQRDTIHPPPRDPTNSVLYENIDRSRLFYALYDCKSEETGELFFTKGDIIFILHRDSDAWWTGQLQGKLGLVPHNYLSPVYETATSR